MKRICVFCGSRTGVNDVYRKAAYELAGQLVEQGLGLVYGGGSIGLMGVLADGVLAAGGEVIGVIPRMFDRADLLHSRVTDMRIVESMHARKALMLDLADAFIAMPGAYGTLEELVEVLSWSQLGIHRKPIGLLNVADYFDGLLQFIDHSVSEGFLKPKYRELLVVDEQPSSLLAALLRRAESSHLRA